MNASNKTLLIGWDAADWNLITPLLDAGQMPNLARLVEGGVMGNLATLQPCLSPMLWTSIATGKLADKHGILGFVEPAPDGGGVRLSTSTSRTTKAIWNILSQNNLRTHVVGWYASHPAEPINGVCVSDQFLGGTPAEPGAPWPLPGGAVHPRDLADDIARLCVHPRELGPNDLLPFIPRLNEIDLSSDGRPGRLAAAIAKAASVHAVATAILDAEPWDFLAVYYDALDVVGHDFMPYHPPQLPGVNDRDFALYQGVINGLYQFHDMMLGRLMQMAGDDATIVLVSDHGFHSGRLRPAHVGRAREGQDADETASLWHRRYGVIVMRGTALKRDERVYGATLLDVAPTLLAMRGLPVGSDMDGRVLVEAFERPPEVQRIPSWDGHDGPGNAGLHPADVRQDPYSAAAAVRQLIDLGYLPPAAQGDDPRAVQIARDEAQFNLAAVYLHTNRASLAKPILEQLAADHPGSARHALALAKCQADLQLHADCRATLESLERRLGRTAETELLLVGALLNLGEVDAAQARLGEIERRYPPSPVLFQALGSIYRWQGRWADAQRAFARALELDEDDPHAHEGLAQALVEQGQFEPAADHALRAVGLLHFFPAGHVQLGRALEGMGEVNRAIRSLEAAARMAPQFIEAHRHLARLYAHVGDVHRSLQHERAAQGYGVPESKASLG